MQKEKVFGGKEEKKDRETFSPQLKNVLQNQHVKELWFCILRKSLQECQQRELECQPF